jgi:hypothetical protein
MDFHDFKVSTPMQSTGECPFVTQIGTHLDWQRNYHQARQTGPLINRLQALINRSDSGNEMIFHLILSPSPHSLLL